MTKAIIGRWLSLKTVMHCAYCSAELPADWEFCGNCGADTRWDGPARRISPLVAQTGCFVLLGLVGLVWLVGNRALDSVRHSEVRAGRKVSVEEISRNWKANELAAKRTYGKSDLEVTGTVTGIATNLTSQAVIRLRADEKGDELRAFMADDVLDEVDDVTIGQTITLDCGPAKALMSKPFVSQCRLH